MIFYIFSLVRRTERLAFWPAHFQTKVTSNRYNLHSEHSISFGVNGPLRGILNPSDQCHFYFQQVLDNELRKTMRDVVLDVT